MTSAGASHSEYGQDGSDYEKREPGARRRKLAGYLKAANELRQTYQQNFNETWTGRDASQDSRALPGGFPDSAVATGSGREEMLIFPSYARRHVKRKPTAVPGTIQESAGSGRDVRDSSGAGDAEFWRQQWDKYEDDSAIVDVDVRGWIFTPHSGPLTRRNRLFIGLARQMVGIPAPSSSPSGSASNSRSSSPRGLRQKMEAHTTKAEEELVAKEAETIMRMGEAEAAAAGQGTYSERPSDDPEKAYRNNSSRLRTPDAYDDPRITPVQKRESWNAPSNMTAEQLSVANGHLMTRLTPFLANPLATTPISAFFYNNEKSRQKTIDTDAYGHFNLRAALDFVPTHVRVLASAGLSATEEVRITDPRGVSIISDVDDTIKHSAIGSGAREIFRNVFIRDLSDLMIQGVRELYQRLSEQGAGFHYVSNSPWQLYPVLSGFFEKAGLPTGSFHLKQYSGMFQGIFEPVAERKKGTLEKILRDFPERRFILFGDSGEADLEVYTDLVCDNPGRVLGVFIRDITTPAERKGFFDSSLDASTSKQPSPHIRVENGRQRNGKSAASVEDSDSDPATKAAIAASLKDYVDATTSEVKHLRTASPDQIAPGLPTRSKSDPPAPEEDLINLDSDTDQPMPIHQRERPARPAKPRRLSTNPTMASESDIALPKTAPPVPVKKSTVSANSQCPPDVLNLQNKSTSDQAMKRSDREKTMNG